MKKGLLKKAFAMFMTATLLVTSVPVTAYASTNAEVPVVDAEETVKKDSATSGTIYNSFQ